MHPLLGYSHPSHKVCLLQCALYDLKQAPHVWFVEFSSNVAQFGFISSPHYSTLFHPKTCIGVVLLLLYVDDLINIGNDLYGISNM